MGRRWGQVGGVDMMREQEVKLKGGGWFRMERRG